MKRYETYKNSGVEWIGEIPEGWEVSKLKYLLSEPLLYGANESGEFDNQNYPRYIRITDIAEDGSLRDNNVKYLAPNLAAPYMLKKGDVLFARSGATVGKTFILKDNINACFAGYLIKASCGDKLFPNFLFYYTQSGIYENWKQSTYTQSTIQNIGADKYNELLVTIPPFSEQQQISSYLNYKVGQIDSSLAKIVEQIEDLKSYRQSVISEAVTKGLNPNAKMKDSGVEWIGEIPEGWKVRNLKYLTEKIGSGVTPTGGAEVYQDHGVIFLRSQNIYPTGLKLTDVAYISEEIDERMCATRVKKGDVLLNITGASIGRCACYNIDDRANVNQHVCIIRPLSEQLYADFLQYVLNSNLGQNSINYVQNGANREGLNFEHIKKFSIPLPPLSEQQQIASYLDSKTSKIDSSIEALELQKSQLEDYKRSVISEAVTGKVDLRGWKTNKC